MTPALSTMPMKDSGMEWIGAIPSHWAVSPFYSFAAEVDSPNTGLKERNLLSLSYGQLVRKDMDRLEGLTPASFEGYNIIEANDIVFRLTDLQNDQRSLRSARAQERGIITSAYVTVRPQASPRFFEYLMRSYDTSKVFYGIGGGIRQSMKFADLKRLPVVVPPSSEMEAIASHLDRATSRIDALVAKKTRFIELLREKRQALITHAVTKGLDASAPMKDSGIEWLGRVPTHWASKRLKHVATIEKSGCYGSGEHSDQATMCIKTCTTAHISADSKFIFDSMEERFFSPGEALRYTGAPGDIFVVKSSGSNTNIISGKLARVGRDHAPVVFTNFLMRVRPSRNHVEPEFLEYFLSSTITRRRIERMVATTTYPNINVSEYVSALVPIPPLEEQRSIAASVNKRTSRIDTLIAKTERSIELLREHRTALITAAVTGKLDLRPAT